jgi:hypothetical protein
MKLVLSVALVAALIGFCPGTPTANPNSLDNDQIYFDTTSGGAPTGKCIDIQPTELSPGVPTVRFEIWFL